ncbi:hypothetical protein N7497_011551 [Penicillium chrysogenum]|nr:hypothetical protein N7497_011551 [Penicillium chrysogenum]
MAPCKPRTFTAGQDPLTKFDGAISWEFFRVLRGNLTIDFNGRAIHRTASDGELAVPPFTHHVIYGTPGTEMNEVEFVVSASDPAAEQQGATVMDQPFFENWYGYQEDMFDAGGTYLSPPWWVPFRSWVGLFLGIVVGRWIGGLLGYAPFYPEWTTDWEAACETMQQSWFQRRFADPQAQERARERFRGQLEQEASAKGGKSV